MKLTKNYNQASPANKGVIMDAKEMSMVNIDGRRKESSQCELYEIEKKRAFVHLNNLITALSIEKQQLINFGS